MMNYAMELATAASKRSEDQYQKVGAIAFTQDNRVIATAYNGLLSGFEYKDLPINGPYTKEEPEAKPYMRLSRLPFMVHAEQNLCSLIRRGEAILCVTTLCPCPSCLLLLAAHGITKIVYRDAYDRSGQLTLKIAQHYKIDLIRHGNE